MPRAGKVRDAVLHRLELLGRMTQPADDLRGDAQGIARAVGQGRIAREFLVREVGVVLERAGRFHDVDTAGLVTQHKFRARDGGFQPCGEVDERGGFPLAVVRGVPGPDQVAGFQVGARAVVDGPVAVGAIMASVLLAGERGGRVLEAMAGGLKQGPCDPNIKGGLAVLRCRPG